MNCVHRILRRCCVASAPARLRQRILPAQSLLRGAKPGDLAVEQADRFDLVLNRRTAAEPGLQIPQAVLLQATEVIE
jgi:putative ABC transport system substrate-binding protein